MDTSWIELPNNHPTYINGIIQFLELAKENLTEGRTQCPCKQCKLDKWLPIEDVEEHLFFKGFHKPYKNRIYHGKGDVLQRLLEQNIVGNQGSSSNQVNLVGQDDMGGLLSAAFGPSIPQPANHPEVELLVESDDEGQDFPDVPIGPDPSQSTFSHEENVKYQKLLECANEELYAGCASFSKWSFILHLFHLKSMCHWSADSFNMLLKLLIEAFPHIKDFPESYYEGKKIINDLGLGYEKIDACLNNCVLYWDDLSDKENCLVCGISRWKMGEDNIVKKGEAAKVVRYFPLIPRLKRMYMSQTTAQDMRWHVEGRVKDGKLRHPADGLAWKSFDERYVDFASEPRNLRFALATDGFNPYRLMNTTYSTWPVVLIPYNLPPWLALKPTSFVLSMIIPGKSSPGNDIDVYPQPLLRELKLLWKGVDTFDVYKKEWFKMRASLMCTINDFPAFAMLSGYKFNSIVQVCS